MSKNQSPKLLRWLLIINLLALVVLGTKHLLTIKQAREERHKQAANGARIFRNLNILDAEGSMRLAEIAQAVAANQTLPEDDFSWCLHLLSDTAGIAPDTVSSRRLDVTNILRDALSRDTLTPSRRQQLSEAMMDQIAHSDPRREESTDVGNIALTMATLHDVRALPYLRSRLHNSSGRKSRTVQAAIASLEERATK